MDRTTLIAQLKQIIVTECDKPIDPAQIGEDDRLIGGPLELDSLDALQISMAVQDRFGVRIEGGGAGRRALRSLNALADAILAARSGP